LALNLPPVNASPTLGKEALVTDVDSPISIDKPMQEVIRAITKLHNGRAPSSDGITAELLKYAVSPASKALQTSSVTSGSTLMLTFQ